MQHRFMTCSTDGPRVKVSLHLWTVGTTSPLSFHCCNEILLNESSNTSPSPGSGFIFFNVVQQRCLNPPNPPHVQGLHSDPTFDGRLDEYMFGKSSK